MNLNLALTILLITYATAESDDAKEAEELKVKSINPEDNAESYTVPVEVVKDVVTESEAVKSATTDADNNEDSRVERSTVSQVDDLSRLDETDKNESDTEHSANRRSNDKTSTAVDADENSEKSAASDDVKEKEAKPETEAVNDDEVLKTDEDAKQSDDLSVKSDDDANGNADAEEKAADVQRGVSEEEVKELERTAGLEDVPSLIAEGAEDFTNFNTRRMLLPLETVVETKARQGEEAAKDNGDDGLLKTGLDTLERSFDSHGKHESQTLLPPLMPVPNKQNFFLSPTLPVSRPHHRRSNSPSRRFSNQYSNGQPLNFLSPEPNAFLNYNSNPLQFPHGLPQLPLTTARPLPPLGPSLAYPSLPNYEEIFRKAAEDSKSLENFNQFSNKGYNRRFVAYSVPNYLHYV